jgi:hypothetical protein
MSTQFANSEKINRFNIIRILNNKLILLSKYPLTLQYFNVLIFSVSLFILRLKLNVKCL